MPSYLKALLAGALLCAGVRAQRASDLTTPVPLPQGSTLVIGFLGGFDRWNDEHRGVRRLTLKLRGTPAVYAESISNHHRELAIDLIRRAIQKTDPRRARIILFGQSWGGAAAVAAASELNDLHIPVLLTVQVDSVGLHDQVIPPNVRAAVNLYQHDPLSIRGQTEIHAADPARTEILGNFGFSYLGRPGESADATWVRRAFGGSHVKMETDPQIWSQVEQYIDEAIARR